MGQHSVRRKNAEGLGHGISRDMLLAVAAAL
jgi:hypothetical protein